MEKKDIIEWNNIWQMYILLQEIAENLINDIKKKLRIRDEREFRKALIRIAPFILASKNNYSVYTQEQY